MSKNQIHYVSNEAAISRNVGVTTLGHPVFKAVSHELMLTTNQTYRSSSKVKRVEKAYFALLADFVVVHGKGRSRKVPFEIHIMDHFIVTDRLRIKKRAIN